MQHAMEFKGAEPKETIRKLVEDLVERLDRKTRNFRPEALSLRCVVEEIPAHKLYRVTATLTLPGKSLTGRVESHDATFCVRTPFVEIERQLEAYKAALRGESWWNRLARGYGVEAPAAERELPALPETQPEKVDAARFFHVVRPHMEALQSFVRHVLAHAEARGELAAGEIAPEDVIDAVLIRASGSSGEAGSRPGRGRLIRLAIQEIEDEIRWAQRDRSLQVRLSGEVPERDPTDQARIEDVVDFYQPDVDVEAVKPEEVMPEAEIPPPEEEFERAEFGKCVRTAFGALPGKYRRVLRFRYMLGLSGLDLEHALAIPRRDIDRLLEEARDAFREQLAAAGCGYKGALQGPVEGGREGAGRSDASGKVPTSRR